MCKKFTTGAAIQPSFTNCKEPTHGGADEILKEGEVDRSSSWGMGVWKLAGVGS
jgi:hypothetical protein